MVFCRIYSGPYFHVLALTIVVYFVNIVFSPRTEKYEESGVWTFFTQY